MWGLFHKCHSVFQEGGACRAFHTGVAGKQWRLPEGSASQKIGNVKCLQKRTKAFWGTSKFRKSYPYVFWIDVPLYILGDKCQGVLHFKKSYSKKRPWTRIIIICSFEFDLKPHEIPAWCPRGLSYHRSWTSGELNLIIRNQGRLRRSCFIHNQCISFTKWGHVFEDAE